MDIEGRVAVVTGAGSGIGRATALRLAEEGAAVVAVDIEAAGDATRREIERRGGCAVFAIADVALEADVRRMLGVAQATFGGVDILVNNAGVVEGITTQLETFPALQPARWNRMLDVNLRGVILGTQMAIEAMRRRGGGVIVNVASMAGIGQGRHDAPVYAASKAAVMRFSAALGALGERERIRVNRVCPDWVETRMVERGRAELPAEVWAQIAPATMLAAEEIAAAILRFVRDDELAGRVMLCCDPGGPHPLLPVTVLNRDES